MRRSWLLAFIPLVLVLTLLVTIQSPLWAQQAASPTPPVGFTPFPTIMLPSPILPSPFPTITPSPTITPLPTLTPSITPTSSGQTLTVTKLADTNDGKCDKD